MSKLWQKIAYIRTSTDKQDLNNEKLEIFEFANKNNFAIDDFIKWLFQVEKPPKNVVLMK